MLPLNKTIKIRVKRRTDSYLGWKGKSLGRMKIRLAQGQEILLQQTPIVSCPADIS